MKFVVIVLATTMFLGTASRTYSYQILPKTGDLPSPDVNPLDPDFTLQCDIEVTISGEVTITTATEETDGGCFTVKLETVGGNCLSNCAAVFGPAPRGCNVPFQAHTWLRAEASSGIWQLRGDCGVAQVVGGINPTFDVRWVHLGTGRRSNAVRIINGTTQIEAGGSPSDCNAPYPEVPPCNPDTSNITSSIPTLTEWGLITFSFLILIVITSVHIRRKQVEKSNANLP